MERWIIKPQNAPVIIRNCSKCGRKSKYACSGSFRVNANGKNLDVWLIYKCSSCDNTWNLELLSRVKANSIEGSLYQAFVNNDRAAALHYAFDLNILNKNKAEVDYEEVAYTVEKQTAVQTAYALEIVSKYELNLTLDKLLSDELKLSKTRIKALFEAGCITSEDKTLSAKTRVRGIIKIKELIFNEIEKKSYS